MAAGFVHGVLNSDNITITGESFDYGPWRFTPEWDDALHRRLFRPDRPLRLRPPAGGDPLGPGAAGGLPGAGRRGAAAGRHAARLGRAFEEALVEALLARLGVEPAGADADRPLAAALIEALQSREARIDRIFFDWRGGRDPGDEAYPAEPFRELAGRSKGARNPAARAHAYWTDDAPCSMHIEEVEGIWAAIAERDDWSPFEAKIAAIRRMGEAMRATA